MKAFIHLKDNFQNRVETWQEMTNHSHQIFQFDRMEHICDPSCIQT